MMETWKELANCVRAHYNMGMGLSPSPADKPNGTRPLAPASFCSWPGPVRVSLNSCGGRFKAESLGPINFNLIGRKVQ